MLGFQTAAQGRSGVGLEAQREAIARFAAANGMQILSGGIYWRFRFRTANNRFRF
jgi:hypothetical protein